ncbi:pyrrolo-quinoline quinone-dependent enzyme [alpha proteobacterium HIMB5]|nr:pyrrolo-quinoline quinone-dependent enzyme [alpha proteobacterium HIMB5]
MIKKKLKLFIVLIFLPSFVVASIYFSSSSYCKSFKIINFVKDFGINQIHDCFGRNIFKQTIKDILKDFPVLYNLAASFKNRNIRDYKLNKPYDQDDLQNSTLFYEKPKRIKGLINQDDLKETDFVGFRDLNFNKWLRSHGDNYNSKFLNDDQINLNNINNLRLFWSYSTINVNHIYNESSAHSPYVIDKDNIKNKWKQNIEVNPIFINGKLVFVSADWKIVCVDIESKKVLWEKETVFPPSRRGIVSYTKDNNDYLILPIGNKIYKIDLNTGKKVKKFGNNGSVSLSTITSPIIDLEKNLVIITQHTNKAVYKVDLENGEIINSIALFDQKKRNFVGGTPWSGTAYDDVNKIIYIPTGNPQPSLYGVKRPGINERSSSIIAVDLNKDEIIWTFQDVFHDLWDYDLAFPPFLDEININNKIYSVVVVVSKTGNTIILDRFNGLPLFDIDFVDVKKSIVEGEYNFRYQRKYILPERLSKIEYTKDDYSKLSQKKQDEINLNLENAKTGYFSPPSFDKFTIIYGLHGGGEWYGGSLNPFEDVIYVPVNNYPWKIKPYFYSTEIHTYLNKNEKKLMEIYSEKCASCHGKNRNGVNIKKGENQIKYIPSLVGITLLDHYKDNFKFEKIKRKHKGLDLEFDDYNNLNKLFISWDKKLVENNKIRVEANGLGWSEFTTSDGNPASNPPWGYVAKLDLKSGKILWKTPIGYEKTLDKEKITGTSIFGGTALNSGGILFVTGTHDNFVYGLNAYTGKIIWEYEMNAAGSAPPTLFVHNGQQYLAVISTGGAYYRYKNKDSRIYLFKIFE